MLADSTSFDPAACLTCPNCGAEMVATSVGGGCPACLLRAVAFGNGADSLYSEPWIPPTVEELTSAFPQLEIVELVGHGGMGAVYRARQKSLGRWVALKILAPQHAAKPDFAERFSREAQVLAEVNHPNIVTVHDFGKAGSFYFLLMEFVDGVNLRQAMAAGRLTPEQALAIVPPICEALQYAHERGIIHRDIKPENLMLDKEGRVKIADFGIARMMRVTGPSESESTSQNTSDNSTDTLTQSIVLGTPKYMAPEQRDRPSSVDHRADIYSLGVVLYEMLTGELPGPAWQPPSLKTPVDVRLDEIVSRALEQNPDLRYQSANELRTRIQTTFESNPSCGPYNAIKSKPRRRLTFYSGMARGIGRVVYHAIAFLGFIISILIGVRFLDVLAYRSWILCAAALLGIVSICWYGKRHLFPPGKWAVRTFAFVALAITLSNLSFFTAAKAVVKLEDVAFEDTSFSCHYDVECPSGWNVWLALENYQLSPSDDSASPMSLGGYQVKLDQHGRVRIPLDEIPKTNEGKQRMLASIRSQSVYHIDSNRHSSYFAGFVGDSQISVNGRVTLLREGESPFASVAGTVGSLRYKTIGLAAKPVNQESEPFEGAFENGTIELLFLGHHPSDGQHCWIPDGRLTNLLIPDTGSSSRVSDMAMKDAIVRIRSESGVASPPVMRFPKGSRFFGQSVQQLPEHDEQSISRSLIRIACPPHARELSFEIGVADGEWKNSISFDRHPYQRQFGSSRSSLTDGTWEGDIRAGDIVADIVPISFRFSRREDYETRLAYERNDGSIVPIKGNGVTSMTVTEFESIRRFHVQSRWYQWVEFRNVSLERGHYTKVRVLSKF